MALGTIVYIGGFEMPDKNAAAHRVLNNAKIFEKLGYHVVFCGVDREKESKEFTVSRIGSFDSIPAKYPTGKAEWLISLFDFSHIQRVIESYDDVKIVVSYNMHAKPLSNLIKYAKKKRIKLIADITEWYENRFSFDPVRFVKWYDTKKVMTKLYKQVNGIIAISKFLCTYYAPFVENIVQIPPLVDLNEEKWIPPESTDEKSVEFVYAGSPGEDKDRIDLIIDCFYELRDREFIFNVVGIRVEQFLDSFPSYRKKIEELGEKIRFWGRVSHKNSIDSLYRADYCIFLRDRTRKNMAGFPTKFVECVTTGVGVIVNDFSNIKDYFPLNNSVLLDSINAETLKNTIDLKIMEGNHKHTPLRTFDYSNEIPNMKSFLGRL